MNDTIQTGTEITPRQKQALAFVEQYIEANGFAPSILDLKNHFGYRSTRSAADLLQALDRKGFIDIAPGIARGIRLSTPNSISEVNLNVLNQ